MAKKIYDVFSPDSSCECGIKQVDVQTLIIHGDDDQIVPIADSNAH